MNWFLKWLLRDYFEQVNANINQSLHQISTASKETFQSESQAYMREAREQFKDSERRAITEVARKELRHQELIAAIKSLGPAT